jgi:hypothetical protein
LFVHRKLSHILRADLHDAPLVQEQAVWASLQCKANMGALSDAQKRAIERESDLSAVLWVRRLEHILSNIIISALLSVISFCRSALMSCSPFCCADASAQMAKANAMLATYRSIYYSLFVHAFAWLYERTAITWGTKSAFKGHMMTTYDRV